MGKNLQICSTVLSILLLISLFPVFIFSQSFPISIDPSQFYTIDKFSSEVYYLTYFTEKVYKKNLLTGNTQLSQFPTLPAFANKSHLCVYGHGDSILIYNFKNNSRKVICNSVPHNASVGWSFSPEDNYILFKGNYYSFRDSTTYQITYYPEIIYSALEWLNDSTIITNFYADDYIYSYCLTTGLFDTIYMQPVGFSISSYSFDEEKSDLYYCLYDPWHPSYPKIGIKNLITQTDSIVFDSFIHDPTNMCWQLLCSIESMKWFKENSSLAFMGTATINPIAGIYVYRATEGKVYRYSECYDEGSKAIINWYSKDTIIYVSSSYDWMRIEGYFLDRPVHMDDYENPLEQEFKISAYPNPFNNTVNIIVKGTSVEKIHIYNFLGEKVKTIENKNFFPGASALAEQLFLWNGNNDNGINLASGVYFVRIENFTNNTSFKLIYLK